MTGLPYLEKHTMLAFETSSKCLIFELTLSCRRYLHCHELPWLLGWKVFAVQCIFTAFWAWPELYGRGKLSKWVICNPYEQLMQECTLNKDESDAEATWLRVSVPSGRHIPGDLISGLGQSPGRLRAQGQSGWSPWTLAVCLHPLSRGGLRSVAPGQGKCPQGQPSLDGGEWGGSTLLVGEGPLWSTGPASAQLHAHRWYRGS